MRAETRAMRWLPVTHLERVMGIEPTSSAWKAEVLPLNYTRLNFLSPSPNPGLAFHFITIEMVEGGGFEPPKA